MVTIKRLLESFLDAEDIVYEHDRIFEYRTCYRAEYMNVLDIVYVAVTKTIKENEERNLKKLVNLNHAIPVYRAINMILGSVQNISYGFNIYRIDTMYGYLSVEYEEYLRPSTKNLSYITIVNS